ncbi:LEA type 2 family protein [Pseudomonas versuta]|uniref:LEA type 2 family protein n=1 Tax=Pseudomonas versuta TaxID=1788301 RepID=UPI0037C9D309
MDSQARITTIALMMILALTGCASWFDSGEKDPDVHLVRVELIKAKMLEQRFKLYFRVDNPNDSTLTVRALSYKIHLGTIQLTEGQYDQWFSVQPNSQTVFVVPVRTNLWPQVRPLVKLLESPDVPIPYQLDGTLETGLFYGNDVHLIRKGEIIPADFIPE